MAIGMRATTDPPALHGPDRARRTRRHWPLALLAAALLAHCSRGSGAQAPVARSPRAQAPSQQEPAMAASTATVAIDRMRAASGRAIHVASPSLQAQAAIPAHYTAYGDGVSPALQWSRVDGAKSYALLVEDPDAHGPQPFVHWVAWNIPADTSSLPEGVPARATPVQPAGMQQGRNGRDANGWFGPRPPAGDPPHHYHFEVFALDAPLQLPADADRDALVAAIGPHLLGSGELVATSQAPAGAH
jgi:Raf kinase inhibitor-like YbhB/YbcL family protein